MPQEKMKEASVVKGEISIGIKIREKGLKNRVKGIREW